MRGDVSIRCAYGAGLTIAATLKTLAGVPVNITGYSARLILQRYDDSISWLTVMSLTSGAAQITNGGASGLFTTTISTANTSALSAFFGSPVPTRSGRFELYATPPAGSEVLLLHGDIQYLQAGEAVDPAAQDIYEDSFTVTVSALTPSGPAGAPGPVGPSGSVTVTGGTVTTVSTTTTTVQTVSVANNSTFTYEGGTSAAQSGSTLQAVRELITGSVDGAGVVTLGVPRIEYVDTDALGVISFTTGTSQLLKQVTAASATSTQWSPFGQLRTVN